MLQLCSSVIFAVKHIFLRLIFGNFVQIHYRAAPLLGSLWTMRQLKYPSCGERFLD